MNNKEKVKEIECSGISLECDVRYNDILMYSTTTNEERMQVYGLIKTYTTNNFHKDNILNEIKYIEKTLTRETSVDILEDLYTMEDTVGSTLLKFAALEVICYNTPNIYIYLRKIVSIISKKHCMQYFLGIMNEKDPVLMNGQFDTFIMELRFILGYLEEYTKKMNSGKKVNIFKSSNKPTSSIEDSLNINEEHLSDYTEEDLLMPLELALFDFSKAYFDCLFCQISISAALEKDMSYLFTLSYNISLLTNEYTYSITDNILSHKGFTISDDLLYQIWIEMTRVMNLKEGFYECIKYILANDILYCLSPNNQSSMIAHIHKLITNGCPDLDIAEDTKLISFFRESLDLIQENENGNVKGIAIYFSLISKFNFGAHYHEFHTLFDKYSKGADIIESYAEFIARNNVRMPVRAFLTKYDKQSIFKFYNQFFKNLKMQLDQDIAIGDIEITDIRNAYGLSWSGNEIEHMLVHCKIDNKNIEAEIRKRSRKRRESRRKQNQTINLPQINETKDRNRTIIIDLLRFILDSGDPYFLQLLDTVPCIPSDSDMMHAIYEIYLFIFGKGMQNSLLLFNIKTPIVLISIIKVNSLNKEILSFMTNQVLIETRDVSKIAYLAIIYYTESAKLNNFDYRGILGYLSNEYVLMQLNKDLSTLLSYIHRNMKIQNEDFLVNYIYSLLKTIDASNLAPLIEICADVLKIVIGASKSAKHNLYFHLYINYLIRDHKCMIGVYNEMLYKIPNSNITDYMICNFGDMSHLQGFVNFRGKLKNFLAHNQEIMKKIVDFPFLNKARRGKFDIIKKLVYHNICAARLSIDSNSADFMDNIVKEPKAGDISKIGCQRFNISLSENLQLFRKLYSLHKNEDLGWFIDIFLLKPNNSYITELMICILKIRILSHRNLQDLYILLKIGQITNYKVSDLYLLEVIKCRRHIKSDKIAQLTYGLYKSHFDPISTTYSPHLASHSTSALCFFYNLYFYDSIRNKVLSSSKFTIKNGHKHGMIEVSQTEKTSWMSEKLEAIYTCNRIGLNLKENRFPLLNEFFLIFEEMSELGTENSAEENFLIHAGKHYKIKMITNSTLQSKIKKKRENDGSYQAISDIIEEMQHRKYYTYVCLAHYSLISSFSLTLLDAINLAFISPAITKYILQHTDRESLIYVIPQLVQLGVPIESFDLDERIKHHYIWNLRSNGKKVAKHGLLMKFFAAEEMIFSQLENICDQMKGFNRADTFKNIDFLMKELASLNKLIDTSVFIKCNGESQESYQIYLPTDPDFKIKAIIPSSSRCIKSSRMPIIVSFISIEDRVKRVIVKKGDDLRQDMLALQLMVMFNCILRRPIWQ